MMILITGGAGYIGSHVAKELKEQGMETVVLDNFSSGRRELIKWSQVFEGDLANTADLDKVFKSYPVEAVVHMAASKAVGESVENPEKYYYNNVVGTLNLLSAMRANGIKKIVFSSSAATFGNPVYNPINEKHPQNPINPYGYTKLVMEKMMADYEKAYGFHYAALRYFNAAGADPETEIGEWPGSGQNLIPLVLDAAIGARDGIKIFGDDYETKDGTCVRDYVHVTDLASAHRLALDYIKDTSGCFNLGNGRGFSVKEVVAMAKKVSGVDFKVTIEGRRPGDPAELIADSKKAKEVLGWQPKYYDLETIVTTAWNWRKKVEAYSNK